MMQLPSEILKLNTFLQNADTYLELFFKDKIRLMPADGKRRSENRIMQWHVPGRDTINLFETWSRLGQQRKCDPADYNSRVVHRSTYLIINFQVHNESCWAPL